MWRSLADLEQYKRFKQEDWPLELIHLKMHTLIRDIAAILGQVPENQELQERLRQLQEDLAALDCQAPWIVRDYQVEMALWGDRVGLL